MQIYCSVFCVVIFLALIPSLAPAGFCEFCYFFLAFSFIILTPSPTPPFYFHTRKCFDPSKHKCDGAQVVPEGRKRAHTKWRPLTDNSSYCHTILYISCVRCLYYNSLHIGHLTTIHSVADDIVTDGGGGRLRVFTTVLGFVSTRREPHTASLLFLLLRNRARDSDRNTHLARK